MLKIYIPASEWYDDAHGFINVKATMLSLEHSLVSISKWESKYKKPFLPNGPAEGQEFTDYLQCMTLTQNVDPNVYLVINPAMRKQVRMYMNDPMTATTIKNKKSRGGRGENVTAEIIYYWMTINNIPFECQKWHLNRLLTLINVCVVKGGTPEKMSRNEIYAQNKALNAARRAKYHSKG